MSGIQRSVRGHHEAHLRGVFSPVSFVRTQKDVLHVDLGIETQQSEVVLRFDLIL